MISVKNLKKSYRSGLNTTSVLDGVSFDVKQGEFVSIMGPSGSGKSTLIRLLIRLYDVQEGRILLDGVDVREYDLQELRRRVGIVQKRHIPQKRDILQKRDTVSRRQNCAPQNRRNH